ncbi:MAG: Histidinol-phosphate aminotransferase [candidate division BRC1 bacterium ADurb.BinA364]|nr:MAG: Histidinol-phosphate aminotransferase [candidate division BRC1 bacterium ADurb.BinA364]
MSASFCAPLPRRAVREMSAYTPGEQPADPAIVKLNTNEFPYPPAPEVVEALRREATAALRLYPNPSAAPLRAALAELCGVAPERVFTGNGSDETLRYLFHAFAEPGDSIAILDPTYSLYPVLAKMFDERIEAHAAGEAPRLPESLFASRARLFVVANPNPPLGVFYPLREIARLADARPEALVAVDEAYAAFAPGDCLALARERANVLVSRTFSKSHALAGMRIGYAVAHPAVIESLDKIRDSYNINRASQAVALAALDAHGYYEAKAREIVETRERLRQALLEMGYRVPPSSGNFLFARSGDGRATLEALRKRKILVRFFDDPALRDGVRITIGSPEEIDRLIEAMRELPAPRWEAAK